MVVNMDWMGPREVIILIGFLTSLAIILDIARRVRRNRYEKLQMSSKALQKNSSETHDSYSELDQSQFPSGGSRVIGTRSLDSELGSDSNYKDSNVIEFSVNPAQQNFDLGTSSQDSHSSKSDESAFKIKPSSEIDKGLVSENVLIIHLTPCEGAVIDGQSLLDAATQNDMRFGEMQIFNKYSDIDGSGEVQFSMANLVNPGTFDLGTIRQITVPGVTIFMIPEDQQDPLKSFDEMMRVVSNLSQALDLNVMDDTRSTMTPQTAEHYRQRAKAAIK